MAFDRKVNLSVFSENNKLTVISDLELSFNIDRSTTFEENTAEFTIFNAQESTRKEILKEGNGIIFEAGYKDEGSAIIYNGNITRSVSQNVGPDFVTTIQSALSQSQNKKTSNPNVIISVGPDVLLLQIIQQIGATLGLSIIGGENARIPVSNGYTHVGSARAALKYCRDILRANGADLYRDNTSIVIFNIDNRVSRFTPVFLDYDSGLLNAEDITDYDSQEKKQPKRIGFSSIIVPKLQPNIATTIRSDNVNGTYIVEKLNIFGDTFGGDFDMDGEAVE